MTPPRIKSRTIIVLLALAAISATSVFVFQSNASASNFSGKIYTSLFDGQFVHVNKYSSKNLVYLNGGPVHEGSNGIPDGTYYFQVTGPSGNDLLSTDPAVCRQVIVANGVIAAAEGPSCQHPTGIPQSDGSLPVKLMPFNDTPNPGGNYKAWLIRQTGNTSVAPDGIHINFQNSNAKVEVFRVVPEPCPDCSPTATLSGKQFYDVNNNRSFDPDEVGVGGVRLLVEVTTDDVTETTVVTTAASGDWSLDVPTGSLFRIGEILPNTGELDSFWEQTAPLPDIEGFQGHVGSAIANLSNLHFGLICFRSAAISALPCPVSYDPPPTPTPEPEPTPTPSPTPCDGDCPTVTLSGRKFYDANRNGLFDEGDVTLQGVQIAVVVTTDSGTVISTVTSNADGNWEAVVPTGAQYLIGEYLPDTDPESEPGSYWEQTAPAANDEGFRGFTGTASADQGGFDLGNVCYHTDTEGNPIPSVEPCTVRYPLPPPPPE